MAGSQARRGSGNRSHSSKPAVWLIVPGIFGQPRRDSRGRIRHRALSLGPQVTHTPGRTKARALRRGGQPPPHKATAPSRCSAFGSVAEIGGSTRGRARRDPRARCSYHAAGIFIPDHSAGFADRPPDGNNIIHLTGAHRTNRHRPASDAARVRADALLKRAPGSPRTAPPTDCPQPIASSTGCPRRRAAR